MKYSSIPVKYMLCLFALVLAVAMLFIPASASAMMLRYGPVEGLLNISLGYGLLARVEDRDKDLIAIASGGTAEASNHDDGTLNYDRGIISNMVRGTAEVAFKWRSLGIYARGYAFYDEERQGRQLERTKLSSEAEGMIGEDADMLEYYLNFQFRLAGMPVVLRLGDQVINWGESTFMLNGVNVINPLDLVAAGQPVTSPRDIYVPQGMIWGAANVMEDFSVEAYYQYNWEPMRFDPIGTFFAPNDLWGGDGPGVAVLGAGRISDLGTDLDQMFQLPAGILGFDENYMKLPGRWEESASDGGQYGVTLQGLISAWNAAKFAVHFVRYHSRVPVISGRTAGQAAVDATSPAAVAARAATLAPIYESTGLPPGEAAAQALQTAQDLTVSGYANRAGYFSEYPEYINMIGFSFNTSTIRTGTLVAGEVSHHLDYPLQIDVDTVLTSVLSPIQFDPSYGQAPLGAYGANQTVRGYERFDKTQVALGIKQLLGPRLGAEQSVLSGDAGWVHIHDMPDRRDLPLQATVPPDADSYGYRVTGFLDYSGVLGGANLQPFITWTHDFKGTTPSGGYIDGRKSIAVGLKTRLINRWSSELSYKCFFGVGAPADLLVDRDFVRFNIVYSF